MSLPNDRRLWFACLLFIVFAFGIHPFAIHACPAQTSQAEDREHIESTIRRFMTEFDVPGLSIAMSKDGRLVLARGFGFADKANETPMTANHRFRIASVSKPITSIAIHTLIQEGKLKYDDKVFGPDSLLGDDFGQPDPSSSLDEITLEHLLTHTVGSWGNRRNDPMFLWPQLDHRELITWTIANQPLQVAPGSKYAYSNFGYCLAGRFIEKATGETYRDYVKRKIGDPIGATSLEIAGNRLSDRLKDEVLYYGDGDENPYGFNASRLDAHGGWVASPTDLVRLALHYDGFSSPSDRLTSAVLEGMVSPSQANANYAKGWNVNRFNNWWHMGSLPGTGAILVRASNGHCWAVLVNTRSKKEGFFSALDKLPWKILRGVKNWPAE
ncbi:MAG: serine hydrolase domain-containing protein [Planctomycetota bacterium]